MTRTAGGIRTELAGGIGTITLDRPRRMNSLDVRMAQDLRRAGLQFARDAQVRVIVLTGAGGAFCAGADLKYIAAGGNEGDLQYLVGAGAALKPCATAAHADAGLRPCASEATRPPVQAPSAAAQGFSPATPVAQGFSPAPPPANPGYGERFKQILEYLHSTISELRRAPKPVIAAVDGIAAAGGLGLAMACDLVIASERSRFEWAYFRTGLSGAESTTFFLPRLVGLRKAMELTLLNPRLDAHQARELGLVTMVVGEDDFAADVLTFARRLAQGPTEAYATAKRLMNMASGMDRLDDHLDRELAELTRVANGRDFALGLEAFLARHEPAFEGR